MLHLGTKATSDLAGSWTDKGGACANGLSNNGGLSGGIQVGEWRKWLESSGDEMESSGGLGRSLGAGDENTQAMLVWTLEAMAI